MQHAYQRRMMSLKLLLDETKESENVKDPMLDRTCGCEKMEVTELCEDRAQKIS